MRKFVIEVNYVKINIIEAENKEKAIEKMLLQYKDWNSNDFIKESYIVANELKGNGEINPLYFENKNEE